ncbi:divalent-cation tolerance protein CutA [Thiotrichales bacterium 19S3-7]|nr:divalent-cation tolerance protein CutA [Thiotrichales bacterium 19S3-7]MCF6800995.1 divalent-cation tolerance protein CutA [Thiotrichales bacterium 19S3-11]
MEKPNYQLLLVSIAPNQATILAELLVESKLAACVNIIPKIESIYHWQGQIQHDKESLLLIKTTQAHYQELEKIILQHHPYDIPEIISFDISNGHENYLNWIYQSLT